ncbi:hypothetical protein [Paenibacillus sp. R14(2021)]|uniref:hypothetical protein n=1 Tax=Paenibacillus sp. R14(2021) TaxID=2859228 RepID=UPI001C6154CC|nr:hypothetical protein [Paenibacillus sp. R14(2021)]
MEVMKETPKTHYIQGFSEFFIESTLHRTGSLGIEIARADGVTFGRPRLEIDGLFITAYQEWKGGQITATEAMRRSGMKKPTFYRRVKEYETSQ